MNFTSPGYFEQRKIRKLLLFLLLAYIILNHAVRVFGRAGGYGPADVASINVSSMAVESFNNFRLATGDRISGLAGFCPRGLDQNCAQVFYAVRVVLGLH